MNEIIYATEERQYLEMNPCNQGYHCFGSTKILGRIGEASANHD